MSHTLIFYRRASRAGPSPDRIRAVLDALPHTSRTGEPGDSHYLYENRATGVEFALEFRETRAGDDGGETAPSFPGLAPAGLSARVDYLRPSFFGLESMPWIAHVARELDLLVLDPQQEAGSAAGPAHHPVETLLASWDAGNTRATRTLLGQEGIRIATAPRALVEAWWRYTMALPDLREHYGDRVAVAGPELVQSERGEVTWLAVWSFPEAAVLPRDVETLFLARERRRFGLLRVAEKGTVPAAAFYDAVRSALEERPEPYPHLRFRPERLRPAERRTADRLTVNTRTRWEPVNPTRLTDVDGLDESRPAGATGSGTAPRGRCL